MKAGPYEVPKPLWDWIAPILLDPELGGAAQPALDPASAVDVPQIAQILKESPDDRLSALLLLKLSCLDHPKIVQLLTRYREHTEPHLRWTSLCALGRMASAEAMMASVPALEDADERVREAAADGLATRDGAAVLQVLEPWLSAPEATRREEGARALARARPEGWLGRVAPLLEDSNAQVQSQVLALIEGSDEPGAGAALRAAAAKAADPATRSALQAACDRLEALASGIQPAPGAAADEEDEDPFAAIERMKRSISQTQQQILEEKTKVEPEPVPEAEPEAQPEDDLSKAEVDAFDASQDFSLDSIAPVDDDDDDDQDDAPQAKPAPPIQPPADSLFADLEVQEIDAPAPPISTAPPRPDTTLEPPAEAAASPAPAPAPEPAAAPEADPLAPAAPISAPPPADAAAATPAPSPPTSTTDPDWITALLRTLVLRKGSDLHLQADAAPRLRIDGALHPEGQPIQVHALQTALASVAGERYPRFLEVGDLDFAYSLRDVGRFRCSFFLQGGRPAAVFRVVPGSVPGVESLRIPKAVTVLAQRPAGLLLVAGPGASGKTTTMASLVAFLAETRAGHILTLEEPVEFLHRDRTSAVTQREVGTDTRSYAEGLAAAERQDVDVVMIGDLSSVEVLDRAAAAAGGGRLVIAGVTATNAEQALDALAGLVAPEERPRVRATLSSVLLGVVAQTLLPLEGGGRVAAYEVLVATDEVRERVRKVGAAGLRRVMEKSKGAGMQTLEASLRALIQAGEARFEDAILRTAHPHELKDLAPASSAGAAARGPGA